MQKEERGGEVKAPHPVGTCKHFQSYGLGLQHRKKDQEHRTKWDKEEECGLNFPGFGGP